MKLSLCLAPVALGFTLVLSGCGGASTSSTARTDSATFALSSSQNATLTVQTQGNLITGTLLVPATSTTTTTASGALSFTIPNGNYGFNGFVSSSSSLSATGNVPTIAPFVLTGQLGSGAANGSFKLQINGGTVSGTLNRTG